MLCVGLPLIGPLARLAPANFTIHMLGHLAYAGAAVDCILRSDGAAQVYPITIRQTDHSFAEEQASSNRCSSGSSGLVEHWWTMGPVHNRPIHGYAS